MLLEKIPHQCDHEATKHTKLKTKIKPDISNGSLGSHIELTKKHNFSQLFFVLFVASWWVLSYLNL
jgi:hypothetical protein